jgi:hypothetical protein
MRILDVNVPLMALRPDIPGSAGVRDWLDAALIDGEPFAVPDVVWSGFLRIATNRRVFVEPTPIREAFAFVEAIRDMPQHTVIHPGTQFWKVFLGLCKSAGVHGDRVPDCYLAALAIESGSELITMDGGFGRYPGLRWRRPVAP